MPNEAEDRTRRADAQRNRAAIVDAAVSCLAANPRASMAEIAQAAGIGRVTLYGHFSSRPELIRAVLAETMGHVEGHLAPLQLDGEPGAALNLLVTSSWRIIDRFHGLLEAAEQELGTEVIRGHHDQVMLRVRRLIERGQTEGAFRSDLPADWLASCFFAILHGGAAEIRAGRLSETRAEMVIPATIQALVAVPAAQRHSSSA
jgi:AcrR family transcriptional regulator